MAGEGAEVIGGTGLGLLNGPEPNNAVLLILV